LHFRTSKKDVNTATISPFTVGGGLEASCDWLTVNEKSQTTFWKEKEEEHWKLQKWLKSSEKYGETERQQRKVGNRLQHQIHLPKWEAEATNTS
jgi:hypothetical protein